jgi:hypothetical protein
MTHWLTALNSSLLLQNALGIRSPLSPGMWRDMRAWRVLMAEREAGNLADRINAIEQSQMAGRLQRGQFGAQRRVALAAADSEGYGTKGYGIRRDEGLAAALGDLVEMGMNADTASGVLLNLNADEDRVLHAVRAFGRVQDAIEPWMPRDIAGVPAAWGVATDQQQHSRTGKMRDAEFSVLKYRVARLVQNAPQVDEARMPQLERDRLNNQLRVARALAQDPMAEFNKDTLRRVPTAVGAKTAEPAHPQLADHYRNHLAEEIAAEMRAFEVARQANPYAKPQAALEDRMLELGRFIRAREGIV